MPGKQSQFRHALRHRCKNPAAAGALLLALLAAGCGGHTSPLVAKAASPHAVYPRRGQVSRTIRATGVIVPVQEAPILAPSLSQFSPQLTITQLAPNGARVKKGDLLVAFDLTDLEVRARSAYAQYIDLAAQVRKQRAQNAADAAARAQQLAQAEADAAKAALELRKAPILSQIQVDENRVELADARAHVASLERSNPLESAKAAANLRVLELQRDNQKLDWQRAESDSRKLVVRSPMDGMLAYTAPPWIGTLAPGTQVWHGIKLLEVFSPSGMRVRVQLSEADFSALAPGTPGVVQLDAYAGVHFAARLLSLSPVATGSADNPIRNFGANFELLEKDPRLLPDLTCEVTIHIPPRSGWLAPRDLVAYAPDGASYVWVRQNGQAQRRPVVVAGFDSHGVLLRGVDGSTPLLPPPGGAQ